MGNSMIPEREELAARVEVSLKEYMEEKFDALEKSGIIAGVELERRLSELNQLRKDVVTDRSTFVTQEVYVTTERERAAWRESINNRVTVIETRSVTWTTAIGIFFVLIQIVIAAFMYLTIHK